MSMNDYFFFKSACALTGIKFVRVGIELRQNCVNGLIGALGYDSH